MRMVRSPSKSLRAGTTSRSRSRRSRSSCSASTKSASIAPSTIVYPCSAIWAMCCRASMGRNLGVEQRDDAGERVEADRSVAQPLVEGVERYPLDRLDLAVGERERAVRLHGVDAADHADELGLVGQRTELDELAGCDLDPGLLRQLA